LNSSEADKTSSNGQNHEIEGVESSNKLFEFPASSAQKQLWFLNQFDPETPAYNIPFAYHLKGILDEVALEKSFNEIVRRHETFRTNFASKNGELYQYIKSENFIPLNKIDITKLSSEEQDDKVKKLVKEESTYRFDLRKDSLLRTTLIKLNNEEHVLIIVSHHIILDHTSVLILTNELTSIYSALCSGTIVPLKAPSLQFADWVMWLKEEKQAENLNSKAAYWTNHLQGKITLLELPSDRPRPARLSYKGAEQDLILPKELSDKIREFSRKEKVSLYVALLSAFKVLLYKYTGQSNITVGTPFSNRLLAETEEIMGCCMNTLPLLTEFSSADSFRKVLDKVRSAAISAQEHQEVSFDRIVENLQPVRDPSYNPLYQVLFTYQEPPISINLKGLIGTSINTHTGTSKLDISLWIWDNRDGIRGLIEYSTDLFNEDRIFRLKENFHTVLEIMIAEPDKEISSFSLLNNKEQKQILIDWNETGRDLPEYECVHQIIEAQVKKYPDRTAVEFGDKYLSYKELDERANQVANYLIKLGIGPDMMVGICIERSIEMVVGLLGILKAGAAYVPLDSSYPLERLAFMMEDTDLPVLLTQKNLADKLPKTKSKVILLDDKAETILLESKGTAASEVNSSNLAYVIYTSGSTGKPKGVLMMHRALTNLLHWQLDGQEFRRDLRTLQFTTLSFDVAFQEIFSTWYSGGTLVLMKEEERQDLSKVLRIIKEKKVDRIFLPFAALQQLAELFAASDENSLSLKEVITAGEQLQNTPAIINFFSKLNDFNFVNHYGPSESHVVTSYTLSKNPQKWMQFPPIGKPIFNTKIYILDTYLNPVPVGIPGELYIGGISLARGYHNRPELTEERFINSPFSDNNDEKLYKTGDLARFLPDGNIEYLGRFDKQVKLRGFRVELGEVESVLNSHPDIAEALTEIKELSVGDKRLVAYLRVDGKNEPSIDSLRNYLKLKLPEYMVPSFFVFLEKWPLTLSGKIDRKALPVPAEMQSEREVDFPLPANDIEKKLAEIWEDTLSISKVGMNENFFDLGGHSLLAVRMLTNIKNHHNVGLDIRDIFEHPTVASLAKRIEKLSNDANEKIKRVNEILKKLEAAEAQNQNVK
jgi:surfactin family lipopeptide synthetase A